MPVLSLCALVAVTLGLWLPAPASSYYLALGVVSVLPILWWLTGSGGLVAGMAFANASLCALVFIGSIPATDTWPLDASVQGCVVGIPAMDERGERFMLDVRSASVPGLEGRMALRTWQPAVTVASAPCWQLQVRLKPVHGTSNPGSPDPAISAFRNGTALGGYVRDSPLNQPLNGSASTVSGLRTQVYRQLQGALPQDDAASIIPAIAMGVRHGMQSGHWDVLRATGTTHLMAISGLHVGLVAWLLWHMTHYCAARVSWLSFAAVSRFAALVSCLGAITYAALAGFSPPTARATGMLLVLLLLQSRGRGSCGNPALMVVFLGAVMSSPPVILGSGFWLSYIAVFALLNGAGRKHPGPSDDSRQWSRGYACLLRLYNLAVIQVRLSCALLLPGVLAFGQAPLLSPIANLFAIPWFSFVCLPVVLTGACLAALDLPAARWVLGAGAASLQLLLDGLGFLTAPGWSVWQVGQLHHGAFITALSGVMLLLRPLPPRQCALGGFLLLAAWLVQTASTTSQLRIHILDVGHGAAVIVTQQSRAVVIDTGASWTGGDSGSRTLVPALHSLGIQGIDRLYITHAHNDHIGGVPALLAKMPVVAMVAPFTDDYPQRALTTCRRGDQWQWGLARLSVLHPANPGGWSRNDASCVILLEWPGGAALFPGDIELRAEAVLAAREQQRPLDLLLIPHHGSRSSSTPQFIASFPTRFAIASTDAFNRWGFPHRDVTGRWQQAGACVLTTGASGALEFRVSRDGTLYLQAARKHARSRPWAVRAGDAAFCGKSMAML